MAIKFKLKDEAEYDALPKHLRDEYKKQDDGSYVVDLEGAEDTGALKRAKEHEVAERKKAQKALKETMDKQTEIEAELAELRENKTKAADKDVAATEKAWQAKLAKREKELTDQLGSIQKALKDTLETGVASSLAAELAGDNAELLTPHLLKRLRAEIVDGKAVTRVLGEDGEVSALTPAELKKEILSSDKFAALVIGSKGSGGGAAGARKGAGGSGTKKKLSEMSATEEAQFANANPAEYQKMVAADQGTAGV
jgi:hypothetical protein